MTKSSAPSTELEELRKRIERESYWCEDCQLEIAKREAFVVINQHHFYHEVVKITILAGWPLSEIDEGSVKSPSV